MKPKLWRQFARILWPLDEAGRSLARRNLSPCLAAPPFDTIRDMEEVLDTVFVETRCGGAPANSHRAKLAAAPRIILRDMDAFRATHREGGRDRRSLGGTGSHNCRQSVPIYCPSPWRRITKPTPNFVLSVPRGTGPSIYIAAFSRMAIRWVISTPEITGPCAT